jgi:hypothetical protein
MWTVIFRRESQCLISIRNSKTGNRPSYQMIGRDFDTIERLEKTLAAYTQEEAQA